MCLLNIRSSLKCILCVATNTHIAKERRFDYFLNLLFTVCIICKTLIHVKSMQETEYDKSSIFYMNILGKCWIPYYITIYSNVLIEKRTIKCSFVKKLTQEQYCVLDNPSKVQVLQKSTYSHYSSECT